MPPSALLLLQAARHELHLVLEPSHICPLLPVAHVPPAAPQTAPVPAAAPPPRPLPLLCAWLPGQEDPGGLSLLALVLLASSSGPRAESLAACETHAHTSTRTHTRTQVHAHMQQLASWRTVPRAPRTKLTVLHECMLGQRGEATCLRSPSRSELRPSLGFQIAKLVFSALRHLLSS